jgi:hypothetical protein
LDCFRGVRTGAALFDENAVSVGSLSLVIDGDAFGWRPYERTLR